MSLAAYYAKKCLKKLEENIALALAKLSDPASLVNIEVSGALADAASGGMGSLADFAGDYIADNADTLALAALNAAGLQDTALSALNLIYNMMAAAVSAYNNLILMFVKTVAEGIIKDLNAKKTGIEELKDKLTKLHNALAALNAGDPVFEKYLADLRRALLLLELGRRDFLLVRNTLDRSDRWLSKKWAEGRDKFVQGKDLIKPLDNNPYLQPTFQGLLKNIGVPTGAESINNMIAIPKISKQCLLAAKKYGVQTITINAKLDAYYAALAALQTGMPALMKKFILNLLDSILTKLQALVSNMALILNGDESAVGNRPIAGFTPVPLTVSVNAYKWAMDANLINGLVQAIPSGHVVVEKNAGGALEKSPNGDHLFSGPDFLSKVLTGDQVEIFKPESMKGKYRVKSKPSDNEIVLDRKANKSIQNITGVEYMITTDALGALNLDAGAVGVYKGTVADLRRLGSVANGQAAIIAKEAKEDGLFFQQQLVQFLLEANAAIVSGKIRKEALALCRTFINRCDLVLSRDATIERILQRFINTPIPLEETLEKLQDGLKGALKSLGLDKAADMLDEGKFAEFFGLNGKTATYLGAALAAIALLKDCFPGENENLSDIQSELEGEQDLLTIKISFDFDFAIFKNLEDCLKFNAFSGLFDLKEFICFLAGQVGVDKAFQKLDDLLSF